MTLDDLIAHSVERSPTPSELASFIKGSTLDASSALDKIAKHIAERYLDGSMTFEVADGIANAMFSYAAHELSRLPLVMQAVYEAFDSGEYHHPSDSPSTDPKNKYTRSQLLRALNISHAAT